MNIAENIKKVALIFFILLGLGHIISALMIGNNYFIGTSRVINRIFTVPFIVSSVVYGFAGISSKLNGKNSLLNKAFIALTIIIFLGALYLQFFIPDQS